MADDAMNWKSGAAFDKLRQRSRQQRSRQQRSRQQRSRQQRSRQQRSRQQRSRWLSLSKPARTLPPPTVLTLAVRDPNGQAGLKHALQLKLAPHALCGFAALREVAER